MLGAIVGDIIGSRFEFNNTNRFDLELFTPACSFTDDTICTIAMADAVMNGGLRQKKQPCQRTTSKNIKINKMQVRELFAVEK